MNRLPPLAVLLGLAGLLPFLGLGLFSIAPVADMRRVIMLIGYGGVILGFLGGVHQGFALLAPGPLPGATRPEGDWPRAEQMRLLGASGCAAAGWAALVLALAVGPWAGLLVLILSYLALAVAEQRAVAHGWMPKKYMWLRWGLSILVILILAVVLAMRLLGAAG